MPRKDPLTRDAVFSAADTLHHNGTTPTLETLRREIGGSFTTLSPLLNEWKEQQRQTTTSLLEMPETVRTTLATAGAQLWQAASDAATKQTKQIETEANTTITALKAELTEYQTELQRLETALQEATERATKAETAATTANDTITELKTKNTELSTTLKAKETELQKAEGRYEKLLERFEGLRGEVAKGLQASRNRKNT